MTELFLIKFGEVSLKGGNRRFFDRMLIRNIKSAVAPIDVHIRQTHNRLYVEVDKQYAQTTKQALSKTFGIAGFAPAVRTQKSYSEIREAVFKSLRRDRTGVATFKIEARRTDKSFPLTSYEISKRLGDDVRSEFSNLTVDVHEPDVRIHVEVRDKVYVYLNDNEGPGGLPVEAAGTGVVLLSGGIDSPVAAYLMAKRGLKLNCVYFHTYPYTSDEAREKVHRIAEILAEPLCGLTLFTIPFTDVAVNIKRNARANEVTLLMRAGMMAVASELCRAQNGLCLVTGESLSQVASQTPESIRFTESTSDYPVFRPLIGMDKLEIVNLAERIGTYETSILPYEDCCTVFTPDRPLIRPDLQRMLKSYRDLELDEMLKKAVESAAARAFTPRHESPTVG